MFVKQYLHRLPADYDMSRIRERAAARAPLWDKTRGLAFKAFMVQQRGEHGANRNSYSSFYLWHCEEAALDFIFDERFGSVIATFGRPEIETWLAIDARRGMVNNARYLAIEHADIPITEELPELGKRETERNRQAARADGALASIVAIDISAWRLVRMVLSETPPALMPSRHIFEIAYLATPGLQQLDH